KEVIDSKEKLPFPAYIIVADATDAGGVYAGLCAVASGNAYVIRDIFMDGAVLDIFPKIVRSLALDAAPRSIILPLTRRIDISGIKAAATRTGLNVVLGVEQSRGEGALRDLLSTRQLFVRKEAVW